MCIRGWHNEVPRSPAAAGRGMRALLRVTRWTILLPRKATTVPRNTTQEDWAKPLKLLKIREVLGGPYIQSERAGC
jgi:hypothetical protein